MKIKELKGGKMKQKYVLGIVTLSVIAVLGVSMVSAFVFENGFMNSELTDEEKAEMQEQREAMQTAIEDRDYSAWETLMLEKIEEMKSQITEENFNKIAERNEQMQEMKESMQQAREEFCEENDCPDFEKGEMNFRGHPGPGMEMGLKCPFAEADSE